LVTRRVPSKGFKVYPTSILLSQVQRSARTHYVFSDEMSETSNVSPDFSNVSPDLHVTRFTPDLPIGYESTTLPPPVLADAQ
jgi:hypothetical protein